MEEPIFSNTLSDSTRFFPTDETAMSIDSIGPTLTHPEVIGASDLLYHFAESPDLMHWVTPNTTTRSIISEIGTIRLVSVFNPNAPASFDKWFVRLDVKISAGGMDTLFAPANLSAKLEEPFAVNLSWNDNSRIETGFRVERSVGSGFALSGETITDRNKWKDENVFGSTAYTYRVLALNGPVPSDPSNQVTITLPLDTDGDGLSDQAETSRFGTNPFAADSDNDGMADGWEVRYGLNPGVIGDETGDLDDDDLSNLWEFRLGLNPTLADSDGNGILDGAEDHDIDQIPNDWEISNGLNPQLDDAQVDQEPDGLSNLEEFEAKTLPLDSNTDDDSEPDGKDGWPTEPLLAPPRLTKATYAILMLPPTSEWDSPILGDGGHVLLTSGTAVSVWNSGTLASVPIPRGNIEGVDVPEYASAINKGGTVVGVVTNNGFDNRCDDVFSIPLGGTSSLLTRLHERQIEEGDDTYAQYTPPIITNNGNVYSHYFGNNSDGYLIHCGVGWNNGTPSQLGGRVKKGGAPGVPYTTTQTGTIFLPSGANEQGVCIGRYALGLDQPEANHELGTGIWNGSLYKIDTVKNRSKVTDINKDNHTVAYIDYGTEFFLGIWVFKDDTWTPRQLPSYILSFNDKLQGAGGTQFYQNDLFYNKEELTTRPGLLINYLYDINNHGVILCNVTEAATNRNALLLPFELVDTKDRVFDDQVPQGTTITDAMRDVNIEPKKDAGDTNIRSTAWIEPHGADDGSNAPDMPQIALRIRGTDQMGIKIKWKLKVEYKRPSGRILTEDTIKIPQAGGSSEWITENLDGAVEIFNHPDWIAAVGQQSDALQAGRGFFGGDVELTWQLLKADDSQLIEEQTMLFRIAGKNPDDLLCRPYIDQVAQSLVSQSGSLMWYAYAIAKSETKGEGGDPYYNQFLRRGDKYRDRKGSEGRPNWNNDGAGKPGGYGVKQVTGYKGKELADVPRSVIWNWQHNVDEGLRELSKINKEARSWMQRQRAQATTALPAHQVQSVLFSDGTNQIMEDAVAIKRYNGASRRGAPDSYTDPAGGFTFTNETPQPKMGHYCYWDKPRNKWSLSRYNAYKKPFVYIDRVCPEVDP